MKIVSKKYGKLLLLGAAAWGAYNFYQGKGFFNKFRFKEQHDAVCNYLESHYPDATYTDIVPSDEGWSCVINRLNGNIVLHLTKTDDGRFIFWEKEI